MPTISMFYGILIRMFLRDAEKHHVPHIHADYQGKVAKRDGKSSAKQPYRQTPNQSL